MDYFKALTDLLKTEQAEDRRLYREMAETASISDRRAGGLAWYPIAIRDTEMGRGDYLTVEVERTTHQDITHQLRFGASAALFSNHDIQNDRVEGTISFQSGNKLKITLNTDELPEWTRNGKLGIDLLFDDNSYSEMFGALRQAGALVEKAKEGRLVRVLTGQQVPEFEVEGGTGIAPERANGSAATASKATERPNGNGAVASRLNPSQQAAVTKILSANDLAIVHGPPGTGKTTTLVQAIKALVRRDRERVLVVAPSNTAVDLLSEKLADEGLNVLRVGNPARVSERLLSLTLDSRMAEHSGIKEIKKLKKKASEFRDMAHKYKRNFGKAEREQRKALFDEARNVLKEVERLEQFILDDVVAKAQVVTATLVGANHYTVRGLRYRTVVIDEAGQALEPACWIPILKADRVVLAGDHCQLPPTIKSEEAARGLAATQTRGGTATTQTNGGPGPAVQGGLSTTLLEKNVALHPEAVVLLEEQYRMHATIMGYSSGVFYADRLKAHPSVAAHLLFEGDGPLAFVDTAGCGFDEKPEGAGLTNPEEAAFLIKHATRLVSELSGRFEKDATEFPTIAIISPYRNQVHLLQELLLHSAVLRRYAHKITVNTIDSFQGQERDIVYIGMTRSNADSKIGFLSDIRRMNVAMTRARKKLVVIGDSGTLSRLPFYANFISYAEQREAYLSAWEFVEL
ncbi:MAG TPA: AAA domain-containing protein [Puia sp.]|nr:AAA domain-containing protein [Puia sp.]